MKNDNQDVQFLKTKIGLVIALVVSVFLVVGLFGFFERLSASNKNKKQEQVKMDFYQKEKEKIESRLSEISSEDGIDKTVRENFNLVKDGEGLVVIIEEDEDELMISGDTKTGFLEFFGKIFKKNP